MTSPDALLIFSVFMFLLWGIFALYAVHLVGVRDTQARAIAELNAKLMNSKAATNELSDDLTRERGKVASMNDAMEEVWIPMRIHMSLAYRALDSLGYELEVLDKDHARLIPHNQNLPAHHVPSTTH
jgi:hypothetical protein